MTFNRLFILNTDVSGMNRFLFQALQTEGFELLVCDIPLPRLMVLWAYISTFHFNIKRWKKQVYKKLGSYLKSSLVFRQRTKYCEKLIKRQWREGDLIIQIAGLFAPALSPDKLPGPYAVFLSFTTKLAAKEYPPWTPFPSEEEREAWYALEAILYQNASLLLTTNAHVKSSLSEDYGVKTEAVAVIGYGINLENIEVAAVSRQKDILFIGYDFNRKGGPTLLKAFSEVRQTRKEAQLTIVGPPPPTADYNEPGVNWLGPIKDRKVVSKLLSEAAVFVMPSICEPFGLVFLEAMAYGVPCIGSRRDAMPEIIKEGETGYLIEPGDYEDLAAKINLILDDEELRQKMGKASMNRVQQHFTWQLVGQRINTAINNIS